MDTAKLSQVVTGVSWRPLKEPRGFIRIVEWILAIFAFATASGFSSYTSFTMECNEQKTVKYTYSYPFRLYDTHVEDCYCTKPNDFMINVSCAGSSQFFVAIGVLAFLYCMAILVVYLFFNPTYKNNPMLPNIDLGCTAVFAVFWLISAAAWAKALSDLKYSTSPNEVIKQCSTCTSVKCEPKFEGNYASLNVSVMFGFLNWLVWTSNIWFLYKESTWFKARQPQAGAPDTVQSPPGIGSPTGYPAGMGGVGGYPAGTGGVGGYPAGTGGVGGYPAGGGYPGSMPPAGGQM